MISQRVRAKSRFHDLFAHVMSRSMLSPVNFGPQTKSLWPARSSALSSASPARGEPAPSAAVIARGIFGIVGVRASLPYSFVRGRSVGPCGTDCEWGIIYNGFSKPNYPTRRAGRGGRLAARFLPQFPLCICNDPPPPRPSAGELPRDVFLRTRGAIIIGTEWGGARVCILAHLNVLGSSLSVFLPGE